MSRIVTGGAPQRNPIYSLCSYGAGRTVLIIVTWCPRRESNPYLKLRKLAFYPLNYGGPT